MKGDNFEDDLRNAMAVDDSIHILIVEDERDTARLYQDYLQDDYETTIATSGEQAIQEANQRTDIVLLDRSLPRMSGKEVLKWLETEDEIDVRVAMLTSQEPTEEILSLNIDEYKTKPIYRNELINLINMLLRRNHFHEAAEELFRQSSKLSALDEAGNVNSPEYDKLAESIENDREAIDDILDELTPTTL